LFCILTEQKRSSFFRCFIRYWFLRIF